MAKNAYIGVDNVARKVKQPYIGVDNVARKVKSGYVGIDNVARQCFELYSGPSVGDLAVGTSVYLNGKEFIVIHQGYPSDVYHESCDGTWVMMKSSTIITHSDKHSFLTENIFSWYIGEAFKDVVKSVQVPYDTGQGFLFNEQPCPAFLLSATEIGLNKGTTLYEGTVLDYFKDGDTSKLITYYDSLNVVSSWWLRTQIGMTAYIVTSEGTLSTTSVTYSNSMIARAALILPPSTHIDENLNVIP